MRIATLVRPGARSAARPPRVLVVEDDAEMAAGVRDALARAGFAVAPAGAGAAGAAGRRGAPRSLEKPVRLAVLVDTVRALVRGGAPAALSPAAPAPPAAPPAPPAGWGRCAV